MAAPLLVLPLVFAPVASSATDAPAAATAVVRTSAVGALSAASPRRDAQDDARQREVDAAGALEDSTATVRAAAARLARVGADLSVARAQVARSEGTLQGAQARAAAAERAVTVAEQNRAEAQAEVATATAAVEKGRDDVGALARRSYQQGRLGEIQDVMSGGAPQQVVERANQLRSVFRYRDASVERLTSTRLALAGEQADLLAVEREVRTAREKAQAEAAAAATVAARAQQAEARVTTLVQRQQSTLASAQGERAADEQEYGQAQDASRELAERIRAAAAAAAARLERERVAAQQAEAERAAAERAGEQRAAERAAAEQQAAEQQAAEQQAAEQQAAEQQAAEQRTAERAGARRPSTATPKTRSTTKAAPPPPRRTARPPAPKTSAGGMRWPCYGCRLTSRFGNRVHPIFGTVRLHAGIDLGAAIGTPVHSAGPGVVTVAGSARGYGTLVVVSHGTRGGRDLSTAYGHMSAVLVRPGQIVEAGTVVGRVGNEGNSTGPHLHFEVRVGGNPVDPLRYVSP